MTSQLSVFEITNNTFQHTPTQPWLQLQQQQQLLLHTNSTTVQTPSVSSHDTAADDDNGDLIISNNLTNAVVTMIDGCQVVDRQFLFLPWSNPDNVVTLETLVAALQWFGLFVSVVGCAGVVLNSVNCVVYARLGLKDRINLLLFSQGCADVIACATYVLYSAEHAVALLLDRGTGTQPLLKALTNSGVHVINGSPYVSAFLSTLIACERCLCITRPFTAKRLFRTSVTAVIVVLATLVLYGLYYFISEKYQISCQYIPAFKSVITVHVPSRFYLDNTAFVDALNVIVFGVSLPAFFVLTTALTTMTTALQLKKAAAFRQASSHVSGTGTADSREVAVTRMLVGVSCLFVVCTVPNVVIRTASFFVPGFTMGGRRQNAIMLGACFIYAFGVVNSSLNFFFYYHMGSKFRATLRGMCRLGGGGGGGGGTSSQKSEVTMITAIA